ncbi:MAG: hypothetical protein ACT4NU_05910 [Chromatiales bacterium]
MRQTGGAIARARERLIRNDRDLLRYLGISASILFLVYFAYCFLQPLTPGRLERSSASLIPQLPVWSFVSSLQFPLLDANLAVAAALILTLMAVPAVYGLALYLSWGRSPRRATVAVVVGAASLFFVTSFLALPNHTTDIYNYISRARVAAVHHSNPHYVPATRFPDDPLYIYASPRIARITGDKLAFWTHISTGVARLAGDSALANLFGFRLLFLLCNLANVALIAVILHRLSPQHVLAGTISYAWNPVVAVLGQSKTDTVMLTFMLLAVLGLVAGRKRLAVMSMGLSALIKFITLPLIAVYWLRDLRFKRWRELAVNAIVLILLATVLYAPFWEGPALVTRHLAVVRGEAGPWAGEIRWILHGAFLLAVLAIGLTRDDTHESLIRGWAWVMLFFAVFLARASNSWYLITVIGMASLCRSWGVALLIVVLSCSAFSFNLWYTTSTPGFRLPDLFAFSRRLVYIAPALAAASVVVVVALTRRRRVSARMPHG